MMMIEEEGEGAVDGGHGIGIDWLSMMRRMHIDHPWTDDDDDDLHLDLCDYMTVCIDWLGWLLGLAGEQIVVLEAEVGEKEGVGGDGWRDGRHYQREEGGVTGGCYQLVSRSISSHQHSAGPSG